MREAGVDARKKRILQAIIEDYVLTAMPVGSRTISRKYETSLSSATIRNEMSDLEEMGYLAQPHVSAGRVPSQKAYRLYVDGLLQQEVAADEGAKAFFTDQIRPTEDVATAAAQALAELTRYTAVVMMPKQLELRVSCLQLVPMPRGSALLVIVTDTGAIRDTVIRVSERLDSDALFAISRLLTERLSGRTLQEVQEMLGVYARMDGPDARVLEGIASLAAQMEKQSAQDTVIIGGSHNILSYPEYSDVEKARKLYPEKLAEYESIWGSIEERFNLIHYLLKYSYTENWEREVNENYLPLTVEALLRKIPEEYDIVYSEHYVLPYVKQQIKRDSGIDLKDATHFKILLKRKRMKLLNN